MNGLGADKGQSYATHDWQILIVNLVAKEDVFFRVGAGYMYEVFTGRFFPDFLMGVDLMPGGGWPLTIEGRLCNNTDTKTWTRTEANFRVSRMLFSIPHLSGYVSAGVMFQRYYESVNFWSGQVGLRVMVY
jgi:hypothetical protein